MIYEISISTVRKGAEIIYLNDHEAERSGEWDETKYISVEAVSIQEALEKAKAAIEPGTNWRHIEHQEETTPGTIYCRSLWNDSLIDDLIKLTEKK